MMTTKTWYRWTTHDEITFLEGLGSHREQLGTQAVSHQRIPRLDLLTRYRASLAGRADWGKMDREEVTQRVDAMIAAYRPQTLCSNAQAGVLVCGGDTAVLVEDEA